MALTRDPTVLLLGHSFVNSLNNNVRADFESRASLDFKLQGTASVRLHGVCGRTVEKLRSLDLIVARQLSPVIIIL